MDAQGLKIILNIAAGTNLLVSNRLAPLLNQARGEIIVYNLDIYNQVVVPVPEVLPPGQPHRAEYLLNKPDVEYSDATAQIDFEDGAADVIMAVSPYGFPLLNRETMRVLKPGGYVLAMGATRNPYIKDTKVFAPGFVAGTVEEVAVGEASELVQRLVLCLQHSYVSQTSHGEHATPLQKTRVWRKL